MTRKTALIIGNSVYQDPALAQLKAPDADVRGLTELLSHPEVGQFEEVVPLVNASEAKTRLAIATFFARARPDDMLLLYFSGHGVLDDKGRLYLAATDTQRELPQATAISAAFVTDAMDSSHSRRQVLILDCCHSGAFARGARGASDAKAVTAATFEGTGYGRAVLTATDATQYAWEGDAVMGSAENSVFTHCVIEGLRTGAADTDQDGVITLEELYTYVYGEVVKRTPKQTPRKWSYNQEGEFVIARNPHPLTPPVIPLPEDLQRSVDDLRPWVREGALLELERLLFGSAPGLAAAALAALQKLKDDDSRRISVTAAGLMARYADQQAADEAARQGERHEAEARRAAQAQEAQAALAEKQRLEREAQDKADREKQAQAALAERQRREREQQIIAEREKNIQARLAERQRREREQKAQAEEEVRRRAERPAAATLGHQAGAALSTGAIHDAPPQAAAASRSQPAGEAHQPQTATSNPALKSQLAKWLPIVIIAVGWAASCGLVQALVPDDHYPDRLPWLLNWMLSGAAGGYLTGLALERLEPNWRRRQTWQSAAAWASGWVFAYICIEAARQYVSDADQGWSFDTLDLPLTILIGALGGYLLGRVWRSVRSGVTNQDVGWLSGGWAVSWLAAALVATQVQSERGWVVAWAVGGLVGGLAGGLVTAWVASRVRARPERPAMPPSAAKSPVLSGPQVIGPLAIIALGWAVGWIVGGGGYAKLSDISIWVYLQGVTRLIEIPSSGVIGAIGSGLIVLALRRVTPAFNRRQARRVVAVWTASMAFSAALAMVVEATFDENSVDVYVYLPQAVSWVVAAGFGGYYLARAWGQTHTPLSAPAMLRVALAWAGAFGVSYLLLRVGLQPIVGPGFIGWGVAGLLAGALGGAATLRVFTRPAEAPTP